MDNPQTKTPGSKPIFLLLPTDHLNSEDYIRGDDSFKLIETGNLRAINGKFLMAYSVGSFFKNTYKVGEPTRILSFLPKRSTTAK